VPDSQHRASWRVLDPGQGTCGLWKREEQLQASTSCLVPEPLGPDGGQAHCCPQPMMGSKSQALPGMW
jgi:hypothetical protein